MKGCEVIKDQYLQERYLGIEGKRPEPTQWMGLQRSFQYRLLLSGDFYDFRCEICEEESFSIFSCDLRSKFSWLLFIFRSMSIDSFLGKYRKLKADLSLISQPWLLIHSHNYGPESLCAGLKLQRLAMREVITTVQVLDSAQWASSSLSLSRFKLSRGENLQRKEQSLSVAAERSVSPSWKVSEISLLMRMVTRQSVVAMSCISKKGISSGGTNCCSSFQVNISLMVPVLVTMMVVGCTFQECECLTSWLSVNCTVMMRKMMYHSSYSLKDY